MSDDPRPEWIRALVALLRRGGLEVVTFPGRDASGAHHALEPAIVSVIQPDGDVNTFVGSAAVDSRLVERHIEACRGHLRRVDAVAGVVRNAWYFVTPALAGAPYVSGWFQGDGFLIVAATVVAAAVGLGASLSLGRIVLFLAHRGPVDFGGPAPARRLKLTDPRAMGDDVYEVQKALLAAGFRVPTNGVFGPETEAAVRSFQSARGAAATGIVDHALRKILFT